MSQAQPDESRTRDTILDAAEPLFANAGFEGTTTKTIGRAAGVNPALIYYYFDDKAGLYRACLERLIAEFARRGGEELCDVDPSEGVRRLVAVQVDHLSAHPNLVSLMVREMLDHQASHARTLITDVMGKTFRQFVELIAAGQRDGRFRPELDPAFAALSIIAQVVYFMIAQPAIRLLLEGTATPTHPDLSAAFGHHAATFALAALRAPLAVE